MRTETDGQLVARTRAGDLAAFEEIVTRHRAALVALAAARVGSRAEAEDAAQEALVQAFFRLHQLREPEALRPWLARIVARTALLQLRGRREEPMAPAEVGRLHAAQEAPEDGTALLLQPLPEAMRRTVTLTYLAGYTCAEAATLLGVQEGTIKSRLSRARALLKEAFGMAEHELTEGKPDDAFTRRTIDRLMREARRLLQQGKLDEAAVNTDQVLELQAKQLFASGNAPGFRFDEEAVRISERAWQERRRRDAEANAAQYGFRLEELDWQVGEVDMLSNTLAYPGGQGADVWGIPLRRVRVQMLDYRDLCRRFQCSPMQIHAWVQQGMPTLHYYPFVRFDLARVRQWLADRKMTDWPKEEDRMTDAPLRILFRELHRGAMTPGQAEDVARGLGIDLM